MHVSAGDTAWVLASTALVMLMTPGLAFFYGGMVRIKNVLSMLMQSYVAIAVVSLLWVFLTYTLAFGPDAGGLGLIGSLRFAGLAHMHQAVPGYAGQTAQHIPPMAFVAFQMMFAVITPALITGSVAGRLRLGAFVVFVALWSVLVYAPVAHWVFSPDGWLARLGAEDFAGGTVVHINAGAAGLALAAVLGRRRGWPERTVKPHNLPLVLLGTGLLWFGWFGFNAGSALGAGQRAAPAFLDTNTAAAAGLLAWILVERLRGGKPSTLGAASGAVAGLVAITPACGFVGVVGATVIGLAAGAVCPLAVTLKHRMGLDDALDVGGVHLVGGVVGALLVGVLGSSAVGGVNGLLHGGGLALLGHQAVAVAVVGSYSFGVSFALAKALDAVMGLRVSPEDEARGLDAAQHGEAGYDLAEVVGRLVGGPGWREWAWRSGGTAAISRGTGSYTGPGGDFRAGAGRAVDGP
ncbi:MAG: ammonium transporter [Acidimicrobiales bacterium]